MPQELEERQALREKVRGALKQLQEAGQEHLHPADEDARVMQCKEQNRNAFAYNGQAVADEQTGIVVACEATTDCNDEQQLNAMLDKVEEQAGQRAERTLADTGYATGPEFEQAEKKERDVVVSLPQVMRPNPDKPYAASNFTYDKERDLLICPLGEELAFRSGHYRKDKGYHLRRYQCANTGCPHRAQCTNSKTGRTVDVNQYYEVIKRQRDKQQLPAVQADLKKRGYLIEPVFAFIKQHLGFRRFTVSGLDNVQAQWAMMCTTYNLHKLFKHWKSGKNPPTSPGQTPKSALPSPQGAKEPTSKPIRGTTTPIGPFLAFDEQNFPQPTSYRNKTKKRLRLEKILDGLGSIAEPKIGYINEFGFGGEFKFEMRVDELKPDTHVKWICLSGHSEWQNTVITFDLEDLPGRENATLLRFAHKNWLRSDGVLPNCSYDWAQYLRSLRLFIEEGKGTPS